MKIPERAFFSITLPFLFLFSAAGAAGQSKLSINGSVDWERMEISAIVGLDLASAGIRLPTGRSLAEELLSIEYPRLIRPSLLSIPVDSSSTIEDLIAKNEFTLLGTAEIALSARRISPVLSTDLSAISAHYTINMRLLSSELIRHSRPLTVHPPLMPVSSAAYTGIIIIASTELPVHGRNASAFVQPCLFPKIWDTEMNLIYDRAMTDPAKARQAGIVRYAPEAGIFRSTPSGLDADLEELVGPNPLRIIARSVFGIRPTDPVIDRQDALVILSTEEGRRLLREGRIILALRGEALRAAF